MRSTRDRNEKEILEFPEETAILANHLEEAKKKFESSAGKHLDSCGTMSDDEFWKMIPKFREKVLTSFAKNGSASKGCSEFVRRGFADYDSTYTFKDAIRFSNTYREKCKESHQSLNSLDCLSGDKCYDLADSMPLLGKEKFEKAKKQFQEIGEKSSDPYFGFKGAVQDMRKEDGLGIEKTSHGEVDKFVFILHGENYLMMELRSAVIDYSHLAAKDKYSRMEYDKMMDGNAPQMPSSISMPQKTK